MKFKAEIEVPDNATWAEIEEAKIKAEWKEVVSTKERMKLTNLEGKCGSCKYFVYKPMGKLKSYGDCTNGHCGFRQRSTPKCKEYEKK